MDRVRLREDWRYWLAIAAIVLVALALRVQAYSLWDQHHADEFFQYLEQANRIVTGYGMVPWESRDYMRNALPPQFLSLPIRIGDLFDAKGMLPIHLARISFAGVCLLALVGAWRLGAAKSRRHALVALLVAGIWYDSVQFSVLLLTESVATAVLALGAALLVNGVSKDSAAPKHLRLAGFLLVLGFLLRIQYAPFVAALVIASARLDRKVWWELFLGAVVALAVGVASDLASGHMPLLWIVNAFRLTITEGRAAEFGTEGPLFYPKLIGLALGVAAPAIIAAALLAGRRYWPLILAAAVNLAFHTAIDHKEYRYIWVTVFMILVLAAIGSVNLADWLAARRSPGRTVPWAAPWAALLVVVLGWIGLSQTVLGDSIDKRLKKIGGAYSQAGFTAAAKPETCGIAAAEKPSEHLIKAILRRNVPVYVIPTDMGDGMSSLPQEIVDAANVTIADGDLPFNPEYRVDACFKRGEETACVLIRPGTCNPAAGQDYEMQKVRERIDM